MSTKILFLWIVHEIPKGGEKSMTASCGDFTGQISKCIFKRQSLESVSILSKFYCNKLKKNLP